MAKDDFFAEEARMARSALRNLVKDAGSKIAKDSDVRPLIRKRPLIALLAAAGGGFVTGYVATPARLDPEQKRRLRAFRKVRKHHSSHRLQKGITSAVGPALRSFAATAAGMLFHNVQQGADDNNAAGRGSRVANDEYSHIPGQRIQI